MSELGGVKKGWERFIKSLFSRIDYFAMYPCKVIGQNADGTLELVPDSKSKLATQSKVPLRRATPQDKIKVSPGSRVLLAFEEADPGRAVALLFDYGMGSLEYVETTTTGHTALVSPDLRLGSLTAAEAVVRGDTYRTAEALSNAAIKAALTAAGTAFTALGQAAAATACGTAATAIGTMEAGASGYLSDITKVP